MLVHAVSVNGGPVCIEVVVHSAKTLLRVRIARGHRRARLPCASR